MLTLPAVKPGIRKLLPWAALALAAVAVFAIGLERSVSRGNDFDNFYDAAVSVWHHGALLREKGTARYLPSFQVLLAPLGALPIGPAAFVWLVLNFASYGAVAALLARVFDVPVRDQGLAWFCVLPFVIGNVTLGQNGPLLLGLGTAGVAAAALGRERLSGAALAVAGMLKVLPAALLGIPLLLGHWAGTVAGAAAAGVVVALCMAVAIGPGDAVSDMLRWLTEVRGEQTPQRLIEISRGLRYNNQGLAIVLARTFGDFNLRPEAAAPGATQLLRLPLAWIWTAYSALVALLVAVFLAVAWRVRSRGPSRRDFLGVFALAVAPMLAGSPIVWTHYFLWLLPAYVYLARFRTVLWITGTASLLAVWSSTARGLGFHMFLALALFAWIARDLWRGDRVPDAPDPARGTEPPVGTSENPAN